MFTDAKSRHSYNYTIDIFFFLEEKIYLVNHEYTTVTAILKDVWSLNKMGEKLQTMVSNVLEGYLLSSLNVFLKNRTVR